MGAESGIVKGNNNINEMYTKFKVTPCCDGVSYASVSYGGCLATPPTRHDISLTRTENIDEMDEWILETRDVRILGCMYAWRCMI